MAKPSVPGAGNSDVWSSGEYRNYVRDMMTNFGSQYNRRREAETSASDAGRQSKGTSMKSMGQGLWGNWRYNARHFFLVQGYWGTLFPHYFDWTLQSFCHLCFLRIYNQPHHLALEK